MISKFKSLTNSKISWVIVALIAIPFVFWGMGDVFTRGNTNNVAKINNNTISVTDFINHINESGLNQDLIRENIDNNIFEELLSQLISLELMKMEIENLNLNFSDQTLKNKIINNKNFLDDKNNFSRTKYEKFLLENNLSAAQFENRLKSNELQKILFNYINGGLVIPKFLINKKFTDENKNIEIDFVNLEDNYKKDFSSDEIDGYINLNEEKLKKDFINFSYVKITPNNLLDTDEYNDEFFKIIDEIDNKILNNEDIEIIAKQYNLKLEIVDNYYPYDEEFELIYSKKESSNQVNLIDNNDHYLLFQIHKIENKLPDISSNQFREEINISLINQFKFEYNKKLLEDIQNKNLKYDDLKNFTNSNEVENLLISSIIENNKFSIDAIKLIYSLPEKSFVLINDAMNNIYLAYIKKINNDDQIEQTELQNYLLKSSSEIRNTLYSSYDIFLSEKYEIKVFQNTIERLKNNFR
ncbi:SurA N-terminal domain-containing protein [Candidatus Pelagibacter sp.]|nr:SurA N-terminal domain-containing protein [Candidatus Pelagibacter sp.]